MQQRVYAVAYTRNSSPVVLTPLTLTQERQRDFVWWTRRTPFFLKESVDTKGRSRGWGLSDSFSVNAKKQRVFVTFCLVKTARIHPSVLTQGMEFSSGRTQSTTTSPLEIGAAMISSPSSPLASTYKGSEFSSGRTRRTPTRPLENGSEFSSGRTRRYAH